MKKIYSPVVLSQLRTKVARLIPSKIILFILAFSPGYLQAATYYWVGGSTASDWSVATNWSSTLGGLPGASAPGSSDIAYFDGSDISSVIGAQTGTVTVNFSGNITAGQLILQNSADVLFQQSGAAARVLTIGTNSNDGTDFYIVAGSTLNITGGSGANTMTVTQNNSNNSPAQVDGILKVNANGIVTKAASPSFTIGATGTYEHARDGGSLLIPTWSAGSIAKITGITVTLPTNLGQTYDNFTWNAGSQTAALILNNNLTINNTFTLTSTGTGSISLNNTNTTTRTLATKNFTQTGGTLDLSTAGNASTIGILSVSGTFNQTAGTITKSGGSTGTLSSTASKLVFNGNVSQNATFVSATGIGTGTSVEVNSSGTAPTNKVSLQNSLSLPATNLFLTAGELNLGSNVLTYGSGLTIQRSAGTLNKATGSQAYSGTVNVTYLAPATTGDEIPTTASALSTLTINPTSGTVTLGTNALVNGNVTVSSGTFELLTFTADRQAAGGTFTMSASTNLRIGGTNTFPNNYSTNTVNNANATVEYYGSGQNVKGLTYMNLTISGGSTKTLAAATTVSGVLNLSNGVLSLGASTYTLTFGTGATVTGTFSNSAMIQSSGTGSVIKQYAATGLFTFPMGTGSLYTPATVNITTATITNPGTFSIRAVASAAPSQLDATYSLTKYWLTSTTNMSGITATLLFNYDNSEANNTIQPEYISGYYTAAWATGTVADVDKTAKTINFTRTGVANLTGNWTAGPPQAFSAITYYSRANGNWESPANWSTVALGGVAATTYPTNGSNVVVGNGNTITMTAGTKSMPSLQIDATGTVDLGTNTGITVTTLNGSGTLRLSASSGTAIWPTITTNNFITTSGSTVEFNGSGTYSLPALPTAYRNLVLSGGGTKTSTVATTLAENASIKDNTTYILGGAASTTTITGNLTVGGGTSGTLTLGNTASANKTLTVAGNITVTNGAAFNVGAFTATHALNLAGNLTNNGTFNLYTSSTQVANTVLNGTSSLLSGTGTLTFNALTVNNGNTATVGANLDIYGALTVGGGASGILTIGNSTTNRTLTARSTVTLSAGATVNVGAFDAIHSLEIRGVLTNNGTFNMYNAAGRACNVTLSTAAAQTIAGTSTYYGLTVNDGVTVSIGTNVDFNGNVVIGQGVSGILTIGNSTTARTVNFNGNITANVGAMLQANNANATHLVSIKGNVTNSSTNNNVSFYRAASQLANVTFSGTSTISGNQVTFNNITVNAGNSLAVAPNTQINLLNGASITNNGTLQVVGSSNSARAIISRSGATGGYTIVQSSASAVFHARYYRFEYLNGNGITISDGTIDAMNNFSDGIFTLGLGSQYLTLTGYNITSGVNVDNTTFDANGATPVKNVVRGTGASVGSITFRYAAGALAGAAYETDPDSKINWFSMVGLFSRGSSVWSNTTNWSQSNGGPACNCLPAATDNVYIKDGHTITIDQNVSIKSLTVGEGISGTLTIGNNTTNRTVNITDFVEVKLGALVNVGNFDAQHSFNLGFDLVNNGTFNLFNTTFRVANVTFTTNVAKQISGAASPVFNHVFFGANSNVTTAAVALDIRGDVTLNSGATFALGTFKHTVKGNWNDNSTGTVTGSGKIEFVGNSSTINNASDFTNLSFSGVNGGNHTITGAITVSGDVQAVNNALIIASGNVSHAVAGNFTINSGSVFNQTTGTLTFTGLKRSINASNATFYNLTFNPNTAADTITVNGNIFTNTGGAVTVNTGKVVTSTGSHTLRGNLNINGSAVFNFSGQILMTGGTITESANADNDITLGTASLEAQGNVWIGANKAVKVNNDVTVTSGYIVVDNGATLQSTTAGLTFTVANNANLYLRGVNNFPTGFDTYILQPNSLTRYDQSINQTVRGNITYGNLLVTGTTPSVANCTKTVDGPLIVKGYLDFNGAGITALRLLDYAHRFSGDVNNATNDTLVSTTNGAVIFDNPNANQTLNAANYIFNDVSFTLDNPTQNRTKTINGNMIVYNDFTVWSASPSFFNIINLGNFQVNSNGLGTFSLNANTQLNTTGTNQFMNSMLSFGSALFDLKSTVLYNGTVNQQVAAKLYDGTGIVYGNVSLANNSRKALAGNVEVTGNMATAGGTPVLADSSFTLKVGGDWLLGTANYTTTSATGKVIFNGASQIISGCNFNKVFFAGTATKQLSGNLNVMDSLRINNGATVDANLRNINIQGNWYEENGGTFNQTTGLTTFNGALANQTVATSSTSYFGNFVINKQGSNKTVKAYSDLDVNGYVNFTNFADPDGGGPQCPEQSAAIFDITGRTVKVGGNWIYRRLTDFISTNSTVVFDGDLSQLIYNENNNGGTTFFNVKFTGQGVKTFVNWNGTASTTPSTINCGWYNPYNIDGNFEIDNATVNTQNLPLSVAGNWVNNGTFQNTNVVTFDGGNQNLSASPFYSVVFAGTGTKQLDGNIALDGNLTIMNGATLDVSVANNTISVGGNWDNSGTGIFKAQQGAVLFTGGNKTIATGGATSGKQFYNVETAQSASANNVTLVGAMAVGNDFVVTTGQFVTGANNITVGGNFINNDVFNQSSNSSILTFNDATATSRIIDPGTNLGTTYRATVVNAPGSTYTLQNNLPIVGDQPFTMNGGTFKLNSKTLSLLNAALTINTGATLEVNNGASLTLGNNGTTAIINIAGGTFKVVGNPSESANIGRTSGTGGYTINQASGTFHAKYYAFNNTVGTGITLNGGSIDPTNNFSEGSFSNGAGGANTQYLNFTSAFTLTGDTLKNVAFNAGPLYNVKRASTTPGEIVFQFATGALAGQTFEADPTAVASNATGHIDWTYPGAAFWDGGGGADNSWHTAANWVGDVVPDVTSKVILDHSYVTGVYTAVINAANAHVLNLTIDRGSSANAITLQINGGFDLDVDNNVSVLAGCNLTVLNTTSTINTGGNWSVTGTFTHGSSTVTFDGLADYFTIASGGSSFYNLVVDGANSVFTLGSPLTIASDLTIADGKLDVSNSNHAVNLAGNWSNVTAGAKVPLFGAHLGTVTLNKSTGTQTVTGSGPFYNITTSGTTAATKRMMNSLSLTGSLTIGANTIVDAGTNNLFVYINWTNNATASAFTQTGSGAVFLNGVNQTIGGTAKTVFNDLNFAGTGTKTLAINLDVNANMNIASTVGIVNLQTYQINAPGTTNSFTISGASRLDVRGTNNFPTGFESLNLSTNSTVYYISLNAVNQTIASAPYGNLIFANQSGSGVTTKTAASNLTVLGSLNVNDVYTSLNINNYTVTLTGNLSFPTGSAYPISWGTNGGTGTLIHVGSDWSIDPDVTQYNNFTLAGSGWKYLNTSINVTGNMEVQSGIRFLMRTFAVTGAASKSYAMASGSRLDCSILAPQVAFPTAFTNFNLDATSLVVLDGYNPQILSSAPAYGNLILTNGDSTTLNGNVVINGYIETRADTLVDGGYNITVNGSYAEINNYVATGLSKFTLGGANQSVYDNSYYNSDNILSFRKITFANSGTKTLGDGNDAITIADSLLVSGNGTLTVNCNRNIDFKGSSWKNLRTFNITGGTLTFSGTSAQTVQPGPTNAFNVIQVSNTTAPVTLVTNGANINGNLTIDPSATLDMGSLTHTIASSIISNSGTWTTNNTNLIFDRNGNQNIPAFIAKDVTLTVSGTKFMDGAWTTDNLSINAGVALNTSLAAYPLTVRGNWGNSGTFTHNGNQVVFAGTSGPLTIASNGSPFYDVNFTPSSAVTYSLLSASTRMARTMNLGATATLYLNSKLLILGSNVASGKNYDIKGTLHVNDNATLQFNNQSSQCVMDVNGPSGVLKVVGSSNNIATITREVAGVTGFETQINVTTGSIHANYYAVEFLSDAGMDVQATATVDATNNFSNGTWSNLRTATGVSKKYLTLNAPVSGTISSVVFNFTGSPTPGTHFNVVRNTGAPITFGSPISGALQGEVYEGDPTGNVPNGAGLIDWPPVSQLVWTGAVSQNWHNALNWLPNIVPDATYDVIIPNVANDPIVLNADANCRLLTITDGILSLQGTRDLTVQSDLTLGTGNNAGRIIVENNTDIITVGGSWTRGTNGIFNNGNSTVVFNASAGTNTISNGNPSLYKFYNVTFNGDATFDLVGAAIDIDGDMTMTQGIVEPSTTNYVLNLGGDFNNNSGTFGTNTVGTVILDGANQNIIYGDFYHLTVAGTGTKTALNPLVVAGNMAVNSGSTLASAGVNFDLNGNVTINTGATFNDGGALHTFSGPTWTGMGTYTGSGTVIFDRQGAQTINASTFNNLVLDGNNNKVVAGNMVVNGDMTVKNTINYLNLQTNTVINSSAGASGTFTLESGGNVYARGTNNFPAGFATYAIDPTSNVYFDALMNQSILGGVDYGNLSIAPSSGSVGFTKTLTNNITVQGSLNFGVSTLDVSTNNYNITLSGNWNNNSNGSFIARNGQVVLNGSTNATQNINIGNVGASGTKSFYDLSVDNTGGGTVVFNNTIDPIINNRLLVSNGILNANGRNVTVGGDFRAFNSGAFATSGTYVLNRASGTAVVQTNGSILQNLTINAPGTVYSAQDDLSLNGNFTLTAGTFNGNGRNITLGDYVPYRTTTINGTYQVGAGGILTLGSNLNVNPSGSIEVIGTKNNVATVTNRSSTIGRYNFVVDGSIKAQYYLFQNMAGSGIYVTPTGQIDATYKLSDGTFTNGTSGGTLLKIENAQVLAIDSVSFPTNQGGAGRSNVTKLANTGKITFVESTGVFSGAGFENDPNNRIDWVNSSVLTWIGTINDDWYNLSNWSASVGGQRVPLATDNVIIATAINKPIIKVDGAVCKDLTVNNGAFLTMNTPIGAPTDFDVKGNVFLNGFFEMKNTTDTVMVAKDWSRASTGTFKPGNGTVIFNGSGGLNNINNATSSFYNLVVQGTGTAYEFSANTSILNNLTVLSKLDANGFNLTVGGNWNSATGVFTPGSGTVTFNGNSGTTTINTASPFNQISITGASNTVQLLSNAATNGNLSIDNATLLLNTYNLSVGDGVNSDALNIGSNGVVDIRANESLQMGTNASVNVSSGGVIKIVGTDATNTANVSNQGTGNYSFVVNNGGKIHAKYYNFDYVNSSGVSLLGGALLDPINNFSEGSFSHGVAGGRYVYLQNDITTALGFPGDSTVATNVIFNSGPTKNVKRISGTGFIRFEDADGSRAGFIFEEDDNSASAGRIRWKYTYPTLFWTGNVSTSWHDPLNWDDGLGNHGTPSITTNVFISDVTTTTNRFPLLNANADGTAKQIKIYEFASLTLANNYNMTCGGSMDIEGKLQVATNSVSNILVAGLWSVDITTAGQFIHGGASTVTLNSSSTANKAITPGNSPFKHLVINALGKYQTQSNLDIDGNLTITSGTLQVTSPSHQINVGGNWSNSSTFIPNSGTATVIFDGANQTITKAAGETFNNVTFAGSGTKVLGSSVSVVGNLTINSGTSLDGNTRIITLTGNWINKGNAFVAGTSTVNLLGSTVQQVGRANVTGETFYNLVINNTSPIAPQIDVTSDITIATNGSITFTKGLLESTSADIVTFNNNTTAIGSSNVSHVSGPVVKVGTSDFIFPTGKGGRWARIAISNLSATATFQAEYFNTPHPNPTVVPGTMSNISGKEYWKLDRISGTASAYVKLFWEDANFSQITTLSDLLVTHFNGSQWENKGHGTTTGGAGAGVAGTIQSLAPLTSFSPIAFGSLGGNNSLPVRLISFSGQLQGQQVELTWVTANEENNAYFQVERSRDGLHFEPIGLLDGKGTTQTRQTYSFMDTEPLPGIGYYRLRQVDSNGDFEFSKTIAMKVSSDDQVNLFPNPAQRGQLVKLRITTPEAATYELLITDQQGRIMLQESFDLLEGEKELTLPGSDQFPAGLYVIKAYSTKLFALSPYQGKLIVR